MHIVLATLEYPTEPYRAGGMCWAFAKIARGLKGLGHEVTVVVLSESNEVIEDTDGIPVWRYSVQSGLSNTLEQALAWRFPVGLKRYNESWSLYQALDRLDHERSIDVILAAAAPDSFFAAGAGRWNYVVRISSHWPLMDVSNYIPQKPGGYFSDWMECLACTHADARISPSLLHRDIYEALGCGPTLHILTPMTDLAISDDIPVTDSSDAQRPQRYVLFYGSLQAKKGSLILAGALLDVLKAHPDLHAVFIGRDLTVPVLGSMAERIGEVLADYMDRVHIVGVINQLRAFDFIRHAEWVILPSIMDNLPNALLESMWHARPVLVTRRSGTDDLIQDGVNGLVVDPNNTKALARGLERALSMSLEAKRALGVNARETVLRECDPAKAAKNFERVLISVYQARCGVKPSGWTVAWRLWKLRIQWAYQVIRYYRLGVPKHAVRKLEKLCATYLPGYTISNV